MAHQYFCSNERRRQAAREHASINGIDYLEVLDLQAVPLGSPRQHTLLVRCLKPLPAASDADNVSILGGVRVTPIEVLWARRASDVAALPAGTLSAAEQAFFLALDEADRVLVVRTDSAGDFSTYRLCLMAGDGPLTGFDPLLAEVDFSFKVECPADFDCAPADDCPPASQSAPAIDYLAKDYASFRRLMLDRLSQTVPEWQERNPADVGVALVEVLAYAADHLSYFQDAVATEAYLGTARRRPSIRRHARLLDYPMHDGTNARAWLTLQVADGVRDQPLPRQFLPGQPTRFLSRMLGEATQIAPVDYVELLTERQPEVFEPLFAIQLNDVHNEMRFYTWGDEQCCLPRGATRATLVDDESRRLRLVAGDVLILEEAKSSTTGLAVDADPGRRHAVRLIQVSPAATVAPDGSRTPAALVEDELFSEPVVEIEWHADDALPFPLCISTVIDQDGEEVPIDDLAVAHGNVVLADHGRTVPAPEELAEPTGDRLYRPTLQERHVTQRQVFSLAAWSDTEPWLSASAARAQDPRRALPAIELRDGDGQAWQPEQDLLGSDRFDTDFVLESEDDGRAALRFGDERFGRRPAAGVTLQATYRVGGGSTGNVGAEALAHVLTTPGLGIEGVRNPLPAVGGIAPERTREVKQYAPQAFRTQERAVTEEDYRAIAERHPDVLRAVARRRWTGSWHTMFITVDRRGGRPVDAAFEDELSRFIECFQLAGHDVEIAPPRFVPLDVALKVCVEAGHARSEVKRALLETFSSRQLTNGQNGYFHPDNFTFDQAVYLSPILAAAMEVPGVRWVVIERRADPPGRFHRWGERQGRQIEDGFVTIGNLEIARLDNDPNMPENGKIEFHMEGGL